MGIKLWSNLNVQRLLLAALVLLMIFSSYSNTWHSPPVLDDAASFLDEPRVYLEEWSFSSILSLTETRFGWSRWIPMVTFAFNHSFFEDKLLAFHMTNIVIHMAVFGAALFLFLEILKAAPKESAEPLEALPRHYAFWIAGLWALHPVQTSTVTYLVQRMASIEALFYTLAVALYMSARRRQRERRDPREIALLYGACALSALGAFLSKENSAILPVMLLVVEFWFFRRDLHREIWMKLKGSHWVTWLVLAALCAVLAYHAHGVILGFSSGYKVRHFDMIERLLTQSRVVVWYMTLLLLPLPSRLCFDHDISVSTSLLHPPATLFAVVFLGLVIFAVFLYRRRMPIFSFGLLWFLVNLVIESSVVPLELIFEHRLYLPSMGFILAVVTGLVALSGRLIARYPPKNFDAVFSCILAIVLALSSLLTFVRNEAWSSPLALYGDVVQKYPEKPRARANFAVALLRAHQLDEAIRQAEKAVVLGKGKNEAYAVAAQAIVGGYLEKREFQKAVQRGQELLGGFPARADAGALPFVYLNMTESYKHMGRLREAFMATSKAMDITRRLRKDTRYLKLVIMMSMREILLLGKDRGVDFDEDGRPDPGGLPPDEWIVENVLKKGEEHLATEFFARVEDIGRD